MFHVDDEVVIHILNSFTCLTHSLNSPPLEKNFPKFLLTTKISFNSTKRRGSPMSLKLLPLSA